MRSFIALPLLVAFASAQTTSSVEEEAHQAVLASTDQNFALVANLLNTSDEKFHKLINDVMQNYVIVRILDKESIWRKTKEVVDQSGLSDGDKEQFYGLLTQALHETPPSQTS
uniref:DUF148 domain-containing protein n=1 Tax=Steinernema glaseri TaxID=37863 RepID=A0A1I7YNP8_9BILA